MKLLYNKGEAGCRGLMSGVYETFSNQSSGNGMKEERKEEETGMRTGIYITFL